MGMAASSTKKSVLASPRLSMVEMVHLLGFANQTSLALAVRRWFAASPRELRSHREPHEPAVP
jgi:AraC-like DNA-binding protein